jgi:hypothetical protein
LTKKVKTEEQKTKVREQARLRKQKQREKAQAAKEAEANGQEPMVDNPLTKNSLFAGVKGVSDTELKQLQEQMVVRDFDCPTEYLMTLMRVDGDRIKHDQAAIGTCASCKFPLPKGCGGISKGQFDCSYIHGLPLVSSKADNLNTSVKAIQLFMDHIMDKSWYQSHLYDSLRQEAFEYTKKLKGN